MTREELFVAQLTVAAFARRAKLTPDDLRGKRRKRHIVAVRRAVAVQLRNELGISLPWIGRLLNRNHATVINYLRPKKCHKTESN